jgi:hypothetical protein
VSYGGRLICSEPECDASIPNHAWGKIKEGADWFFPMDGSAAWCPKHLPDWVEGWRGKRKKAK